MTQLIPVILSGGSGTRLWPMSREAYPKQFLPLLGDQSLLQATVQRLQGLEASPPLLVCNQDHRFMVAAQLQTLGVTPQALILEPLGRNTAPAVAIAALQAILAGQDPLLLILPADHVITDIAGFQHAVHEAQALAEAGYLVTFGIQPHAPETGYGYIQAGGALDQGGYTVTRFVEKPDRATAEQYLTAGEYYWNSGMFLFRAQRFLEELDTFRPDILTACRKAFAQARRDLDFLRLDAAAFEECPGESIDYAVMEPTQHAAVLPLNIGWNDVGSWTALWEVGERDADDNILVGDVLTQKTHRSYIHAQHRLVAAVGVDDLMIVETPDAVLVTHKDHSQEIKTIVEYLKRNGRSETKAHRKVHRPWGAYDSIDIEDRFQVKRITVNPGARLSLQMHHHRAEHWIVVNGTARVTCDDHSFLLRENESTYIPLGSNHRLENPGKIPLELIEVQSGSYLGEDDIVRFEDVYGREEPQ